MMSPLVKNERSPAMDLRAAASAVPSWAVPVFAGVAVGILAASLPLLLTAVLFAGVLVTVLSVARPDLALYLFFCGIVMLTDSSPSGGDCFAVPDFDNLHGLPSILKSFFLFLFCMTFVRFPIQRRSAPVSFRRAGVYLPILLLSLATGFVRGGGRDLLQADFIDLLLPVLCFYLCLALLNSRERIERLLYILIAVGALKAVILSVAYLAGHGWEYDTYRVVTTDSADLLVFITIGLIAFHLLVSGELKGIRAWLIGVACLPMLFAVIFSFRRAQWGGAVASMGLLFWGASRPVRKRIASIAAIALCAAGALVIVSGAGGGQLSLISSRLSSIFDENQSSNVYHREESRQVLADLSKSPLFGLGLGTHHTPLDLYEEDLVPTNIVHNTFLYVWMKTGIFGLVFFGACFFVYVRRILRFRKSVVDRQSWGLVLPLAASVGLWLTMFLTGPTIWYFHQTGLIALFAAMAMSLISQAGRDVQIHPPDQALELLP
jgi:O-antigen ligase